MLSFIKKGEAIYIHTHMLNFKANSFKIILTNYKSKMVTYGGRDGA